jgi:hypothetical protein
VPLEEADALLVLYDPSDELLRFDGRSSGSRSNLPGITTSTGIQSARDLSRPQCYGTGFYGHPDATYRVPHPTHRAHVAAASTFSKAACSCQRYEFRGRLWFFKSHFWTRNRMILDRRVELFGNPEAWARFRHFPKLWIRRPPNYTGASVPRRRYFRR